MVHESPQVRFQLLPRGLLECIFVIENIKDQWSRGSSIATIREITRRDRKTIKKYLEMENFSKDIEAYINPTINPKVEP